MKMLILIQESTNCGGRGGSREHDICFFMTQITESCVPTTGSYRSRYTCLEGRADMTHHETTVFRKNFKNNSLGRWNVTLVAWYDWKSRNCSLKQRWGTQSTPAHPITPSLHCSPVAPQCTSLECLGSAEIPLTTLDSLLLEASTGFPSLFLQHLFIEEHCDRVCSKTKTWTQLSWLPALNVPHYPKNVPISFKCCTSRIIRFYKAESYTFSRKASKMENLRLFSSYFKNLPSFL